MSKRVTCVECGKPSSEISRFRQICDLCVKRLNEARARPYVVTSVKRRKDLLDDINEHFDYDYVNRAILAKKHDDAKRRKRQKAIAKRKEKEMAKSKTVKPDLPKYSYDAVVEKEQLIYKALTRSYLAGGDKITKKALLAAATAVSDLVVSNNTKVGTSDISHIYDLFVPFMRTGMTIDDVRYMAKFIAGNSSKIKKGLVPDTWNKDTDILSEWALIRIYSSADGFVDHHGRPGFYLGASIHTGSLAGKKLVSGYTCGVESRVAGKFGIPKKDLKKAEPKMLVGMIGFGFLELSYDGTPRVRMFEATTGQKKTNKDLLKGRLDVTKCPYNLKPFKLTTCLECPVGQTPHGFGYPYCSLGLLTKTPKNIPDDFLGLERKG